jgi:hypothetical protein
MLVDCSGINYAYTYNGLVPDDMDYYLSDHCSLQKIIDIDNQEQKVVVVGSSKAERVERRLKIALKLLDNWRVGEDLKMQIDQIESAIMNFD